MHFTIGTIILAVVTNRTVSALTLEDRLRHSEVLATFIGGDAFDPLCTESGIDIRTQGAEQFNNQPFFSKNEVHWDLVPANNPDQPEFQPPRRLAGKCQSVVLRARSPRARRVF